MNQNKLQKIISFTKNLNILYIEDNIDLKFSKRISKVRLRRILLKEPKNDLVIKKCIKEGNKELHLFLLDRCLSIENLKLLSEIAGNKKIRNISKEKLKRL